MATDKEGTLQIKDFRGISRFKSSPNTDPNLLYEMKNVYSPRRGEIAPIPGFTKGSAWFPGGLANKYIFNFKEKAVLMASTVGLSAPTIGTFAFATSGSGSTATTVKMSYSGEGGESPLSGSVSANWGSTGISVTLPAYPSGACAANMYTLDAAGIYCWVASFPLASQSSVVTVLPRVMQNEATVRPKDPGTLLLAPVTFTPITGGSLTPGTKLYFAFAPFIRNSAATASISGPIVSQLDTTSQYVSYTIPDGFSGVNVKPTLSGLYDGVNPYTHSIVFAGTEVECLLATGTTGAYCPILVSTLNASGLDFKVLPQETNLGFTIISDSTGRTGYFYPFHQSTPGLTYASQSLAMSIATSPVSSTSVGLPMQVLPVRGETLKAFAGDVAGSLFNPVNYYAVLGGASVAGNDDFFMDSTVLANRLFFVNGYQEPFYTDGRLIQPIREDYQSAPAPICTSITTFRGRLIMGGGDSNVRNELGLVYYSEILGTGVSNPFDWSKTHSATPVRNFQQAKPSNGSTIVGFGVNSYNQSTGSISSLLVIGLTASIFVSQDITSGIEETESNIGFASKKAFVNTNVGSFCIGSDNFYQLGRDGRFSPVGNDVASILANRGTRIPAVTFSDGLVRLTYSQSTADGATGQELWLDVQLEATQQGLAPRMTWYGPHDQNGQPNDITVFQTTDPQYPQIRVAANGVFVYLLDDKRTFKNNGTTVERKLVFNDLTLSADHFIKLIEEIYISGKVLEQLSVTVDIVLTDNFDKNLGGSTETFVLPYGGTVPPPIDVASYILYQKRFTNRLRGRVVKALTLTFNAGLDFSFYDISLLFQPTRRRLMPGAT